MLDAIDVERVVHDRHRNLVVAATGTGKTVVAALDYRRLCGKRGEQPLAALRRAPPRDPGAVAPDVPEVLGDGDFGELYVGRCAARAVEARLRERPVAHRLGVAQHPCRRFDVVVIDEFHHAEAQTYRRIIDHLRPASFSGSPPRQNAPTARTSGRSSMAAPRRSCGFGMRWAPTCLPLPLLRVADGTDLRAITWKRGRYDEAQLSNVFTGNDARARIVLQAAAATRSLNLGSMRALGFCVSVAHAEFMAHVFARPGSQPAPSAARRPDRAAQALARSARAPGEHPLRRRPLQRRPRHSRRRHGAVPPSHRERHGLPAATRAAVCGVRRTRRS